MSSPTKGSIIKAVNATLSSNKERESAASRYASTYGSLTNLLNSALKTASGKDAILDALWQLSDDVSATAGNPFHKLRLTLGNRVKTPHSVKQVVEDGEIVGYSLERKVKKAKSFDFDKVADLVTAWCEKRDPNFLKTLVKLCDDSPDMLLKAIKDGKRNKDRATKPKAKAKAKK